MKTLNKNSNLAILAPFDFTPLSVNSLRVATAMCLTKTRNPDLLVINTTIDFNWKEVFIGNYTQQIVNHAKVPVLSFKEEFRLADLEQNKVQVAEWAKKYSFADPLAPAYW